MPAIISKIWTFIRYKTYSSPTISLLKLPKNADILLNDIIKGSNPQFTGKDPLIKGYAWVEPDDYTFEPIKSHQGPSASKFTFHKKIEYKPADKGNNSTNFVSGTRIVNCDLLRYRVPRKKLEAFLVFVVTSTGFVGSILGIIGFFSSI